MNENDEILEGDDRFPWEDVDASRNNQRLLSKHSVIEAKQQHAVIARPCPKCGAAADSLRWFYFESPDQTWEALCGRAGWMTVCDQCHQQADFFLEVMS